jgi:hypothetical protein
MLPVGLAGLLLSTKWLYRWFVFWTLFSASSVLNIGEGENGSALQVWMFFGVLWLLRLTLEHLSTISFSIDRRIFRPCLWLAAFLFVGALSLVMPLYINGTLSITSPFLLDGSETPLYLTSHNFTQVLYLIFGGVITICVAHRNLRDAERQETERLILLSAIFISLWGLMQFICSVVDIPYPYYIFNNSGSAAGTGFAQVLENVGISRISSAAVEPSIFAQSIVTLLPLTIPAWIGRGSVVSVPIDRLSTVLLAVALVLSTSSTAYLGLLILAFLSVLMLAHTRTISIVRAGLVVGSALGAVSALAVVAVYSSAIVRDVINSTLVDKATTYSGLERVMTISLAYGYFLKFPLLGIGWGSAVSHDLIVLLLSNVGTIGALTFFGAMWCVVHSNWRIMDSLDSAMDLSRATWFLSFTVFLITSLFNGFPLAFGNFWLVMGMAISTSWKERLTT